MRFFIASDNRAIDKRLEEILRANALEYQLCPLTPPEQAASRMAQAQVEVAMVVLSPQPEPALTLIRETRAGLARQVFAIGPVSEPKLRLGALREGADQYLDEAALEMEMEFILRRLSTKTAPPVETGKLISVLAPSGGSGSSTLAVNLATALAKEHKQCALVDLNLGAGDLAALLDLKPTHTLADLCRNATRMDRAIFERSLTKHASGVSLLAPSRVFGDIGQVTAQGVRDAVGLARTVFPYVVVDLDDAFHAEQAQTLRQSDVILLVLRLDFTSLRNTRRVLDHFDQMTISRQRVHLLVNRYGQPQELPPAKAEEVLGQKIAYYVPDDPKTINRANNNGVPAVLEAPTAKVSRTLFQLAAAVNGRPKPS